MNVTKETNVAQSNFLIENRPALTKDETRLFLTVIATINKDASEFEFLQVPVKDFADLWGIDPKNAYQQIKDAVVGLQNKSFLIEGINPDTGKQRFLTSSSLSAASYEEGQGYLSVEISKMFRPYLLDLKEKYTIYVLQNIMDLSSVSSIRLYEFLKQYETIGKREFLFSDLKRMLQMEKKYADNTDFRRYVIEPSASELTEKTDLHITYEYSGRGKKTSVIFTIKEKKEVKAKAIKASSGSERKERRTRNKTKPAELLSEEEQKEIDFLITSLQQPDLITLRQFKRCVSLAKKSDWYQNQMMFTKTDPSELTIRLWSYLKAQDELALANYDQTYYGYFKGACENNWAGFGEDKTESDDSEGAPSQERIAPGGKKAKEETRRYGEFDVREAFITALKRSDEEMGIHHDDAYYEENYPETDY